MSELTYQWDAYARLQKTLARKQEVDDESCGLETVLGRLLETASATPVDVDRSIRSERRGERHRARIRRTRLAVTGTDSAPEQTLHAYLEFVAVRTCLSDEDWALLVALGEGYDYLELATHRKVSTGSLRVRVLRLRRTLVDRERLADQSARRAA